MFTQIQCFQRFTIVNSPCLGKNNFSPPKMGDPNGCEKQKQVQKSNVSTSFVRGHARSILNYFPVHAPVDSSPLHSPQPPLRQKWFDPRRERAP
ncbi:hypothetical protein NPIL_383871 [Nephila pilipes]|uniref:Uncharacterized protein n=1 Tax=Nephila pilipes TaxID=299642 RepID=A0A8X6Q942_NEPPI|nr:hypothetical protein NPIL_383871 [Nephila pilipes]